MWTYARWTGTLFCYSLMLHQSLSPVVETFPYAFARAYDTVDAVSKFDLVGRPLQLVSIGRDSAVFRNLWIEASIDEDEIVGKVGANFY